MAGRSKPSPIANRQKTPEDKKLVEDLYESMAMEQDDNGMYRGRWRDMKPVLCLIKKDHFLTGDPGSFRLDGHEGCAMCGLIEKI